MVYHLLAPLVLLTQSTAVAPQDPADLDAVAADVAYVSTDICHRSQTGELGWAPKTISEEMALFEGAGMAPGMPNGVYESIGPVGQASANRATLASRSKAGFHVVLNAEGSIPGCRVLLVGDDLPGMRDMIGAKLVTAGWIGISNARIEQDSFQKRQFYRMSKKGVGVLQFAYTDRSGDKLRAIVATGLRGGITPPTLGARP